MLALAGFYALLLCDSLRTVYYSAMARLAWLLLSCNCFGQRIAFVDGSGTGCYDRTGARDSDDDRGMRKVGEW